MRRDPKAFRERFAAWKNGEQVYDNGRPIELSEYSGGKDSISTFVSQLGPLLYKKLQKRNIDDIDSVYSNMISQLAYESNYGTSRVAREQHNYGGYGWNGKTYTTFKDDADFIDHYLNIMTGRHKQSLKAKDPSQFAESLKKSGYYEDTVDNYRRNLQGMVTLRRIANQHRRDNIDLYTSNPIKQEEPIQPSTEAIHNSIQSQQIPRVDPIITPQSSTRVDQPWRYVEAQKQVDNSAGWKAMNHFQTLDLLKQVMDGYDWQLPKLPPLFPLNVNQWTKSLIGYKCGKDSLPGYATGEDGQNWFDEFRENHSTASTIASFLPIVGTAMDVYDAYKDPTAKNIGYAALSAATDLIGGRMVTKLAGEAIQRHRQFKKIMKATKKELSNWPYYKNMNPSEARRQIKIAAKERAEESVRDMAISSEYLPDASRFVVPAAIYTPDAIANINQVKERFTGYEGGKDVLPGYATGEDGGFFNWLKNAVIGASVADDPAVATASGWHNEDGQWRQNRTAADEQLGRNISNISMFSRTHPINAMFEGAVGVLPYIINTGRKYGVTMALNNVIRKGPKLSITKQPKIELSVNPVTNSPTYDSSKTIVENFYNSMYDELYRQYDIDKQYKMAYDYARSTGRQALSNSTKTDAINKGFLSDNSDLEFLSGYFKRKPKVTFSSLPKSTVGLYKFSPNEVIIDPAQASINSMVPYHEFLHSLGVGRLPSHTGIDTNNYQYLLTNVTRGDKSLYPRFKRLERDIETGTAFYKDATNGIFKNSARSYIKDPQEAVVHGLEEGAKYGIPPFAPYPGRNVVQKAYFDSLKHSTSELAESLDTTNPQFFENFWKLLTGNFLPMTAPFVITPKTKKKQQK